MSLMLFLPPVLILIFLAIYWFFGNSETAMVSSNKIKLQALAKNGDKRAAIIMALINNPERLFGTTLVGTNLASIISTVLSDYYFEVVLNEPLSKIGIGTKFPLDAFISCIMVPLVLIFGELFPMYVARKYPNATALRNAKLIRIGYLTLYPLMICISSISKFIGKLFKSGNNNGLTRDELEMLVVGRAVNVSKTTKKILRDVFDIDQITAEDVMVHLNHVVAVDENASVGDFRKMLKKYSYNRFPVYSENIFNIVGTVHSVNILTAKDNEKIGEYKEKLYIVPSTKRVTQILTELKRNRKYMGVVVDEFGASCGILTLEDIVDEIMPSVNEMSMEEMGAKNGIDIEKDRIFEATMSVDEFAELAGVVIDEDVQTLGGLVNLILGRIGRKGEIVKYKNLELEVVESSDRVVNKVKLLGKGVMQDDKKNRRN